MVIVVMAASGCFESDVLKNREPWCDKCQRNCKEDVECSICGNTLHPGCLAKHMKQLHSHDATKSADTSVAAMPAISIDALAEIIDSAVAKSVQKFTHALVMELRGEISELKKVIIDLEVSNRKIMDDLFIVRNENKRYATQVANNAMIKAKIIGSEDLYDNQRNRSSTTGQSLTNLRRVNILSYCGSGSADMGEHGTDQLSKKQVVKTCAIQKQIRQLVTADAANQVTLQQRTRASVSMESSQEESVQKHLMDYKKQTTRLSSGDMQQSDESEWTRVDKRKTRRSRPKIIGTCVETNNSVLRAAPGHAHLHVFHLHPSTKDEEIERHLVGLGISEYS